MFTNMVYSLLRTNELLGYCKEIKVFLASLDLEALPIKDSAEKLSVKLEAALAASNRKRASEYTEWLNEKDQRRDDSFLAFRNLMSAFTYRKDESLVAAAEKIILIIKGHGWSLQRGGKKVQSAKMASLIKELSSEENQALLTSLSANDWYADMVTDNTAYDEMLEEKSNLSSNETVYDMSTVYQDLQTACEELFEAVEVLNRISPNEIYTQIATFSNDCTQRYLAAARTRKTKNENSAVEETEAE
ncbi:DUF6261 family protein [Marinifilum sp. RC60d5]|uniref:DUF6261 family protein n=1 Tax=Marinifilum sp. RC60d5 TaxID=3458414 RepID=UPI004036070D